MKAEPSVLVIPESLAAKELKDITIADTTDYTIAGTLATHKLKNGETIIKFLNDLLVIQMKLFQTFADSIRFFIQFG